MFSKFSNMERLLLPLLAALALPNAVNAFPWSSDIVVKTDLGEKYIVKKSSIQETKFDLEIGLYIIRGIEDDIDRQIYERSIKKEKEKIHLITYKFRPIFKDLNDLKIPQNYITVACFNPKTSFKNTQLIWDRILPEIYTFSKKPPIYKTQIYETISNAVCEKYAKFE